MPEVTELNIEIQLLKSRLKDFQQLFKTFQSITSSLQTEKILEQIISGAVTLSYANHGSIILFDPAKKQIAKTLIHNEDSNTCVLDNYLNSLLAHWVYDNSKFLCTNSLIYTFNEGLIKEKYRGIESVLSVPIGEGNDMIGVINLVSFNKANQFDNWDVELIRILTEQCVNIISNALLYESLLNETFRLRKDLGTSTTFSEIIGSSSKLHKVFTLLERIVATDAWVLIEGESGTGKNLMARILHYNGPHKEGPFIAIDCSAFPENLLESELFGRAESSFTRAVQDKPGLYEEAHNGTLFLDEITKMPIKIQSKLLRVLQESEIQPIGSTKVKRVHVRLITAASDSLKEMLKSGRFREDLYYYLNVVTVNLPPLRERKGDVLFLTDHFIKKYAKRYGKEIISIKSDALQLLESHTWPGNIRELENVIERMIILADKDTNYLSVNLLPRELQTIKLPPKEKDSVDKQENPESITDKKIQLEKELLSKALVKNNWHQSLAAKELGIHESTLRYKMKKLGIRKP